LEKCSNRLIFHTFWLVISKIDADPDPAYNFDADPDADPYPAYHFDVDPDPDSTSQFDADLDPQHWFSGVEV
jgi:hypothetical protein